MFPPALIPAHSGRVTQSTWDAIMEYEALHHTCVGAIFACRNALQRVCAAAAGALPRHGRHLHAQGPHSQRARVRSITHTCTRAQSCPAA